MRWSPLPAMTPGTSTRRSSTCTSPRPADRRPRRRVRDLGRRDDHDRGSCGIPPATTSSCASTTTPKPTELPSEAHHQHRQQAGSASRLPPGAKILRTQLDARGVQGKRDGRPRDPAQPAHSPPCWWAPPRPACGSGIRGRRAGKNAPRSANSPTAPLARQLYKMDPDARKAVESPRATPPSPTRASDRVAGGGTGRAFLAVGSRHRQGDYMRFVEVQAGVGMGIRSTT